MHQRVLSALLAAVLMLPNAALAVGPAPPEANPETITLETRANNPRTETITGTIEAAVRLDFDQTPAALEAHKAKAVLTGPDGTSQTVSLWECERRTVGPNQVAILDMAFSDLEQGEYTLAFSGTGYKKYEVPLSLEDHSLYVAVGTGDGTFTVGNLSDEGASRNTVNEADRDRIVGVLQKEQHTEEDLALCDLNGDGQVDIVDLAYINRNIGLDEANAEPVIAETLRIQPPEGTVEPADGTRLVDIGEETVSGMERLMNRQLPTVLERLDADEQISEQTPVTLSIDFDSEIELSELRILTSALPVEEGKGSGEIRDGWVEIEYDDGGGTATARIPFVNQIPEDVELYGTDGDGAPKVITIPLGKRVAVKKVTITVTRTADHQYASIAAIEFLKDIVPENPIPANTAVRSLMAVPGAGQVSLKWSALPNIEGYEVLYYPTAEPGETGTLRVTQTSAVATGLENGTEYTFEVMPVGDGGWRGRTETVTAVPAADERPAKVDMVQVTERDGRLDITWKAGKNAETYAVYYTTDEHAAESDYQVAASGLTETNASITGLTNGTTYYIYVTASNKVGTGPRSNIVSGTPRVVVYERPAGIPTEGLLDTGKIAGIRLVDEGNVHADCGADFRAEYMIDGDYATHWTASNWFRNEHVECTFTEPVDLGAVIWVPRLDGSYPEWLRCYAIRVWTDEAHGGLDGELLVPDPVAGGRDEGATGNNNDMQTWPDVRNNPAQTHFAVLPFGPVEGVTKIQVAVEQKGYNLVSLSELLFMEYDPGNDVSSKIEGLFADTAFTTLRAGVTEAQIAELETLLTEKWDYCLYPETHRDELALARELLAGQGSGGVVLDGLHTTAGKQNYGQGGSLLQPLGVSANAGDPRNISNTITVYADLPAGETVELYATQVNAEASAWRAPLGRLTQGRNVITVPKIGAQASGSGGSLYYTYAGTQGDRIRLHIRRGTAIPVLDVVDWYAMSDTERWDAVNGYVAALAAYLSREALSGAAAANPKNVTEISTPTVLLSLPASAAENVSAETLYNSILAWEDVLHICRTVQGIDHTYQANDMAYRENIRCMQMFEGAFMYAAGAHIGIGAASCPAMLRGTPVPAEGLPESASANNLYGWGIAHEIGHNMDKLGKAEITNNIYSLFVQTYDGRQNTLPSRLETSRKYDGIFTKTAQQYPGASNDVFVQLGLYWQLHLAYDDGASPMGFYNEFFKRWKEGTSFGPASTYEEKVAVVASAVADRDLTAFFTRWGMTLSDAVKAELAKHPAEERAVWYLNDQSRRDRLSGVPAAQASVALAAEKVQAGDAGTDVRLTITPSVTTGTLQGYEIRRNGKAIGFAAANGAEAVTYTDSIGTANHRTFTYTVAAVDTLGNWLPVSNQSEEIRIAYDMTVDPAQYTVSEAADGTVLFTAADGALQISGVKFVGCADAEASFTVTVTDAAGQSYTARAGTAANQAVDDAESFVAYLQKPGAAADDTRIWTYDAQTVAIAGAPVAASAIQLISYAGDDVAFLEEGASVGILKDDFRYGDGADQVIPAGAIVVAGTFRGDPVYNYVKVRGAFTTTPNGDETEVAEEERDVAGECLIFSTIPEDQQVSDISDGMFLFVLDTKQEAELQKPIGDGETQSNCSGVNLLPSRIKVQLYRTEEPGQTGNERLTAETVWIHSPGGDTLPSLVLESEVTP